MHMQLTGNRFLDVFKNKRAPLSGAVKGLDSQTALKVDQSSRTRKRNVRRTDTHIKMSDELEKRSQQCSCEC